MMRDRPAAVAAVGFLCFAVANAHTPCPAPGVREWRTDHDTAGPRNDEIAAPIALEQRCLVFLLRPAHEPHSFGKNIEFDCGYDPI